MGFFDLQDDLSVMPFVLWLLECIGLRYGQSWWQFLKFVFCMSWMTVVTLIPKIFLGYQDEIRMIRGISELIFEANIVLKLVLFSGYLREFETLLTIGNRWYRKTKASSSCKEATLLVSKVNKNCDFFSKFYYLYVMGVVLLFIVFPATTSVWIHFNQPPNINNTNEYIIFMEQEFYWLDIHRNFSHYWIYAPCAMFAYFVSGYAMILADTVMYCSAKCCSNMFKIVSMRIEQLQCFDPEARQHELGDIVQLHIDALRCMSILEDIISLSVLCQVICCSLIWCSMAVYFVNSFDANIFNVAMLFLVLTCETYGMSILGDQLSEDSNEVTRAVYNYPWYEASLDIQKSLMRMLQRAQKKVGFTAAGFYFISIERFAVMVKSSYSIFIVLKDSL
ncbi:putative odorant receptor 85d [Uranotaenia lowii]|uniref:putative odorant receptor 85d n=1 Tax=Uranotaenia lowii TaxID=190385 RepID=UPI00247B0C89|nr:putative odorant receptor 85d [Uranotaenia lowii]